MARRTARVPPNTTRVRPSRWAPPPPSRPSRSPRATATASWRAPPTTITAPPAATPTFSPAGGSFSSAQSVSLADNTPGAVIYYTTNGTTHSTSSTQYNPSSPIQVGTTTTIEAVAVASGYSNSVVASATYNHNCPASVSADVLSGGGQFQQCPVGESGR